MTPDEINKYLPKGAFFEVTSMPTINRINAIDAHSGIEVSMPFPKGASLEAIKKLALQKLAKRISNL